MNRPITISIPHELGVAEAKTRLDTGFDRFEQQIGGGLAQVQKTWNGDRMSFTAKVMGQTIAGRLDVQAKAIAMEIDLPPVLAMIANTIKGRLKKEGTLMLEKK